MTNSRDVDITICGTGPVGLAFAALLVRRGVAAERIALLDAKAAAPTAAQPTQNSDPRTIALSYGSSQILQDIGAWPIAASPIKEIHVSRRGYFGRSLIDCKEYDLPALGYVTRYTTLVETLHQVCAEHGLKVEQPVIVTASEEREHHSQLSLSTGELLGTKVMVQAEGGQFFEQSKRARNHDYAQSAVIANVTASAPMMQRAFERFTDEGPLALLPADVDFPMGRDHRNMQYALVWCMRAASAERRLALPDKDFLKELAHAFGNRLGCFLSVTPRTVYRLGLNVGALDTPRRVAIGNAAQALHPVAGQGFNLGLRDATTLARLLARGSAPEALAGFQTTRQHDRSMTIELTHLMARIFTNTANHTNFALPKNNLSQLLLSSSLGLIDGISPIKKLFAHQMMFGSRY